LKTWRKLRVHQQLGVNGSASTISWICCVIIHDPTCCDLVKLKMCHRCGFLLSFRYSNIVLWCARLCAISNCNGCEHTKRSICWCCNVCIVVHYVEPLITPTSCSLLCNYVTLDNVPYGCSIDSWSNAWPNSTFCS